MADPVHSMHDFAIYFEHCALTRKERKYKKGARSENKNIFH